MENIKHNKQLNKEAYSFTMETFWKSKTIKMFWFLLHWDMNRGRAGVERPQSCSDMDFQLKNI